MLLHIVYDHLLPILGRDNGYRTVAKKLFFSSFVFTFFGHGAFFLCMSLFEGHSLEYALEEVKLKLLPTVINGWKFWPIVQIINFRFVPIHLQVVWVNFMGVFWSAYLSYIKNHNSHHHVNLHLIKTDSNLLIIENTA